MKVKIWKCLTIVIAIVGVLTNVKQVYALDDTSEEHYWENSENNGMGEQRYLRSSPFLSDGSGAFYGGNYNTTEDDFFIAPYYEDQKWAQQGKLWIDVLSRLQGLGTTTTRIGTFESLDVTLEVDEQLVFKGTGEKGQATYPPKAGTNQDYTTSNPSNFPDYEYDESSHSVHVHFDLNTLPNYLNKKTEEGRLGLRFEFALKPGVIGDKKLIPFRQKSVLRTSKGEYVSGISGAFKRAYSAEGEKTVKNLTRGNESNLNYIGDSLEYSITYKNIKESGRLTEVILEDNMPKGFSYNKESLQVFEVDAEGNESEITNTVQIIENTDQKIQISFGEFENQMGMKVKYNGTINDQVENHKILNIASITANDSSTHNEVDMECESEIEVEDPNEEPASVIVKYVDTDGDEIHENQVLNGKVNEEYDVTTPEYKLKIDNYTLDETQLPKNAKGVFNKEEQTVTYIYNGELLFVEAPSEVDFGIHQLSDTNETYGLASFAGALKIQDLRTLGASWSISAQLTSPFTGKSSNHKLGGELSYILEDGNKQVISKTESRIVCSGTSTTHDVKDISQGWKDSSGLNLEVFTGEALADTYQAVLEWTLSDSVVNE
ncbi:MucBP domain-containing protein [Enterococcus faecalis]|uniref:MucBP domain-containing protein n=1 Tax=Enterococcus faecalis TaxID=1351 RepID=UPI00200D72BC|nr:MucBP domain-containing protein [Enterococcus faecalis]MCU2256647.1 MucBP domain-containing protein [Enterococcus faecalis]UQF26365.1 MucBP domain-containing protein [Enterococcus faecalis]UQF57314.1 MucBP domain-containing protein [Enterococcus faecalis]UQR18736.1 MucBP domain-containing protein [Enterococcus faecalis]WCG40763.1 MucBP domain-containing protein [Enterococcus faecalis]